MVICLEQGADLHMAQLMPLPLIVSCFSKIQISFTFLVPAHPGGPGKRAVKRVCVCVCVCVHCRKLAVLPQTSLQNLRGEGKTSRVRSGSNMSGAITGEGEGTVEEHTGHRCCRQAASQVSHTATDGGSTTSAIHCWTPSIRCARPHSLELLAGRPPRTAGL